MKACEYPYFASVQAADAVDSTEVPAAEIRQSHLKHEAQVKSVGACYILGGSIAVMGGPFCMLIPAMAQFDRGFSSARAAIIQNVMTVSAVILMISLVGIGVFTFVVGLGLRGLKPWARILTITLSILGLPAYPIVTIFSVYILYLVLCAKGKTVFSPEYQQIMAETPDIKYKDIRNKTDIVVWIYLGLPIVFWGLCIIWAAVSSR